jgi:hypothetical protein
VLEINDKRSPKTDAYSYCWKLCQQILIQAVQGFLGSTYLGRMNAKKEEFPGYMVDMQPGNSFPQICVVSVSHSVGIS